MKTINQEKNVCSNCKIREVEIYQDNISVCYSCWQTMTTPDI